MKNLRLVAVLAVGLVQGAVAWAETTQSAAFDFGAAVPLTDADVSNAGGGKATIGSTGFSLGGQYLRAVSQVPHLSVGGEFNYFMSGDNKSTSLITNANSVLNSSSLALLGIVKYSILAEGRVLPYVLAGFGFGQSSWKIKATPVSGQVWANTATAETRTLLDNSGWNYALAFGGGVDVPINDAWSWGGELRWQQIGSRTYPTTSAGQALNVSGLKGAFNNLHTTVHAAYRF